MVYTSVTDNAIVNEADVNRFWDVEEPEKNEDVEVENFYQKTTKRNLDGSYTVCIPFKEGKELGLSRPRALARRLQTEKELATMPTLKVKYNETLEEYLTLGLMTLADHTEPTLYFLPHQAVIKEDSTTTPVRVVFDASAKTSNNRSFNDVQYIGPKLQQDLTMLILKFIQKPIAVISDITKMYRQIKIAKEDIPYHRIL